MNTAFDPDLFGRLPVVGILRGFSREALERLVPASVEGGLCNLEVTMNSPGAAELIRLSIRLSEGRANVGAGTVTTLDELRMALDAGASFIVTPALVPDVVQECVRQRVPVMPGAMTPTEILAAWRMGATMVKVFPADSLGSAYIKAVKGPFPQIRLMPTGGVTVETLPAFRSAGAEAFGVGGPLFDPRQAAAGNWGWFREQAARFVAAWNSAGNG